MALAVALTIFNQLGGRRFSAFTGAKNFISSPDALSFRLPKAKDGINAVRVVLDPSDTYSVTFSRVQGTKVFPKGSFDDIYCDQLESLVGRVTGLATRF